MKCDVIDNLIEVNMSVNNVIKLLKPSPNPDNDYIEYNNIQTLNNDTITIKHSVPIPKSPRPKPLTNLPYDTVISKRSLTPKRTNSFIKK
jgi:hypothetical protein